METELAAEIQDAARFVNQDTGSGQIDLDADVAATDIGRLQQRVIVTLADLTTPQRLSYKAEWPLDFQDMYVGDQRGWVRYEKLTQRLVERSDKRSKASIQAGVSRGLDGLIDRGLLRGAYRAWKFVSSEKHSDADSAAGRYPWNDDYMGDGDRPPLKWLQLREDGWIAAHQLLSERGEEFEILVI